jgi:hypothetical protein
MKPVSVYLFTNRNCLVFDKGGKQIAKYQRAITCYRVDKKIARELAEKTTEFYISKFGEWVKPISRLSFEYLLGLRTRKMDLEELEK